MQVIADGGASNTVWRVYQKGLRIAEIKTHGLNPNVCSVQEIQDVLMELTPICQGIKQVIFYGSGCAGEGKALMERLLTQQFSQATIFVFTDLVGTARALLGKQAGYVAILGTGSNVCQYDGEKIVKKKGGLGYLLGDEGSGLSLGKDLVRSYLNDELSTDLRTLFEKEYQITPTELIHKVYKEQKPHSYLSNFAPFINQNLEHQTIRQLVKTNFKQFFRLHFSDPKFFNSKQQVHFSGSIAYYFADQLRQVAADEGIQLGEIARSPIEGLESYHGFLESVRL